MMSKPEYRPCPHCGHQLKVRQYVRRFGVPSLPGGFCPATTAGFGAAGSAIRKRGASGHRVCRGSGADISSE